MSERFKDFSLLILLISNIFSIVMAIIQNWDIGEIFLIYWVQSVIIGLMNFRRIMSLKEFSTEGLTSNGRQVPETQKAKRETAFFFLFHYGFFHFGYFIFILTKVDLLNDISASGYFSIMLCVLGFFGAHRFSYHYNANRDFKHKKPNLGTLLFYPYLRIIPMHLTIVLGGAALGMGSLILFMFLKTLADAGMHMVEHSMFQKQGHENQEIS